MLNISYFHFNAFCENTWLVWNDSLRGFVVDPGYSDARESEAFHSFVAEHGLTLEGVLLTHGHPDHVPGAGDCAARYGIPVYLSPEDRRLLPTFVRMGESLGLRPFGVEESHKPGKGSSGAERGGGPGGPETDGPAAMKAVSRDSSDCQTGVKAERPSANDMPFPTTDISDGQTVRLAGVEWKAMATPGHTPGGLCWWSESEKILFTGDTLFKETIGRTDLPGGDYDKLIVSIMEGIMGLDGDTDILPGHGSPTTISHERTHNPFLEPFNEPEQESWPELETPDHKENNPEQDGRDSGTKPR